MVAAYGGRPFRRLQSIDAIPDSGYLSACSVHHRNGRFVRHGGLCLFAVRGVTGLRQIERSSQGELGKSHRKTKVEQSSQCSTA
jgi:hypothetical protein